jgi:hypothetical protein
MLFFNSNLDLTIVTSSLFRCSASYQHEALNPDKFEICVLHLEPGRSGQAFAASFQHVSLNDVPSYDVLSYMWGDATPNSAIHFGTEQLAISANLAAALQFIRLPQGI